ncbi:7,8-dihydro-8-oxoguanine-triphosphatase [Corynebacterium kutscheri]|uniref:7,8-dihydro-8-oxoguanine-triphosphatase n=1 Tax=Corynebacterium kutscheri TaxID=35755 RepID=A0A0F6QZC3_9CORY|nr:ADP-ribose pyrophosphatase [Corynebacterium kutscheri]VEH06957.1 7,8-dihydro-8-oxoguanine-triphosphatase [Corynebacterium kutscheri]VEH09371.1 7,8-dihydro-8-oxoguanine-triphosphatase [Corynebacterium kutscheri]VEH79452.1 7,8-dihydro-8-oxoguanine-triphosphatase [Corynebacterium kutscheri]
MSLPQNNRPLEVDKDQHSSFALAGQYQTIIAKPAKEFRSITLAAGAVLWRHTAEGIAVACVHRPHYDDWSFPKGKIEADESLPVTAVREILEETGYETRLNKLLGRVYYPVKDRTKVVYYWTASVTGGTFTPNNEVDELRWLPIDQARELLSYELDRALLAKAVESFSAPITSQIIYVRHGQSISPEDWSGYDRDRPLTARGKIQAISLAPLLAAYRPDALYSAIPLRCVATLKPAAKVLGLKISSSANYGNTSMLVSMSSAQKELLKLINAQGSYVIASQGTAILDMITWLSARDKFPLDGIKARQAGVWVLSFSNGKLIGADYLESPLPIKRGKIRLLTTEQHKYRKAKKRARAKEARKIKEAKKALRAQKLAEEKSTVPELSQTATPVASQTEPVTTPSANPAELARKLKDTQHTSKGHEGK